MKIVDDILATVDSSSAVALVGLDISAAFDTVSHRKLLSRLEHDFSIEEIVLEWINSYILKQTFFVRIGNSSSAVAQMLSGVPKGSVLGPILFTAYVSPIGRLIELMTPNSIPPYRQSRCMHRPVGVMFSWITTMVLRERSPSKPDKSEVCFFGTRQKLRHADKPSSIKVAGCCIDVCEKLKTLGVTLDSALTIEDHINGVVRSCNFHIRALRHIRRHLT